MDFITIGKIINVRGLQGEVKIASLTDFAMLRYRKGNSVYLDAQGTKALVIKRYHHAKGFDYVQFQGYPTIASVEPFINQFLYAAKQAIRLHQDSYFHHDLQGCQIFDEFQTLLGTVKKVETFAQRTLLRMQRSDKPDVLIPFIPPFIREINIAKKLIIVVLVEGML